MLYSLYRWRLKADEDDNPYEGVGSGIKTIALFVAVMIFIGIVVSGIADLAGCETEYGQFSPTEQLERESV
jgi:hypothetical protein